MSNETKLLRSRRGDYEVPHLMRWKERAHQPEQQSRALIGPETKIAAIGSCFAERVTEVLSSRGLPATFHPAGLQYNTFSIRQEFEHLFGDSSPYSVDDITEAQPGCWEHPFRKELRADSREAVLALEEECDREAKQIYLEADLIIITLGLTELWERCTDGRVAVELPPASLYASGDYRFRNSTTQENIDNLRAILKRIRSFSEAEVLVTVSPVPLAATFRDLDIIVANCESKSRLRAAVADFLEEEPSVNYFHSYELVAQWQGPETFFLEDGRHVSPQGVAFIMNEFLRMYGKEGFRPNFVPFGEVDMPDQTVSKRYSQLKSKVATRLRQMKGLEG